MRTLSPQGLAMIKNHEGLRLSAYKPVSKEKYYTIGYGHYGSDVYSGMQITEKQAEALLMQDIKKFEGFVNNKAFVPLTASLNQNQFDALVSFAFNTGEGNLQKLTGGNRSLKEIADAMLLYNKGSGQVLPGLVTRRKSERELFLSSSAPGIPSKDEWNKMTKEEQEKFMMDIPINGGGRVGDGIGMGDFFEGVDNGFQSGVDAVTNVNTYKTIGMYAAVIIVGIVLIGLIVLMTMQSGGLNANG
ncbi:lysozyme [Paenibacillus sp. MER 99-2]|uniref:lysozyme n=1 Tax=Paenibacillus sp. MER 99-2 TaxID=2939572 RepID=UPI00203D4015|nr:lysozyme [Paenibacillus sp. MER 99-2]MCM3176232.1 lysozyme [Paenibacillus sp. MER 99-2]